MSYSPEQDRPAFLREEQAAARVEAAVDERDVPVRRHPFPGRAGGDDELQREAGSTHDYHEGVRAFLEKREPRFGNSPSHDVHHPE